MKTYLKSLVILMMALFLAAPAVSFAQNQNYHTNSKKAIKFYKKAKKKYNKKNYAKTFKFVDKSLNVDPKFTDALLFKAEVSLNLKNESQAVDCYERMFAADSMTFPKSAITLSKLYLKSFRYSDAVDILEWYVTVPNQKAALVTEAKDLLEIARFREFASQNPVAFEPVNLGENVNTDGDEYINEIMPDGSRLFFTRRAKAADNAKHERRDEFIYSSAIIDGEYMPSVRMNLDWSEFKKCKNKNMGAVSFTMRPGQNMMYFVGINYLDSQGQGDIYSSQFVDEAWTEPKNLGNIVNTSQMESQPFVSADGKELYFVRNSKNYKSDIYYSELYQGKWSNPKLITQTRTKGDEMSPFIHPDGKTLYFASNGLPGMGGYDIFMCKKLQKGEWSAPVNLGYPINSDKNEICFVVSLDGTKGYISTDREGGMGGYDIYVFDLDEKDRPDSVDMTRFVLRNINFQHDSAVLTESSNAVIDSLANFMMDNPSIRIEISGYTDNSGNAEHNKTLSLERAAAVMSALLAKGISVTRLEVQGYGANNPLVPNDSESNKALNRRVEIRLIL